MNTLRTSALVATAILGSIAAQPARADHDHFRHIESLASQAQRLTRDLSREVQLHLAGTSQYGAVQSDIVGLYQLERRILAGARSFANPRLLHRDVERLHDLIHHVEVHLDEARGEHISHGHHQHHVDVRHLQRIVERLDVIAQRLDDEVHQLDDDHYFSARPVNGGGSRGLSFGGISVQFGR